MKTNGDINIYRDYNNDVFIRVVDHASRKEFLEVKMTAFNFTKLMTGLSGVSAELDLEGLDVVGKKKVVENRTIAHDVKKSGTAYYDLEFAPANEQDARDAERYRYLREHKFAIQPEQCDGPSHPSLESFNFDVWHKRKDTHNREGLDAAIDAAIAQQSKK